MIVINIGYYYIVHVLYYILLGPKTFCVLAEKKAVKVCNLIKRDLYDIVRASWLKRCVDEGRWIKLAPGDMIHISQKTQKNFQQEYDEFGDSFTELTSVPELQSVFRGMNNVSCCNIAVTPL